MSRSRQSAVGGSLAALLLTAAGCAKPHPTQLVISVNTNFVTMGSGINLASFEISAIRQPASVDGTIVDRPFSTLDSDNPITFPAALGIIAADSTDTRRVHVTVQVTPVSGSGYMPFKTEALVSFTPEHATRIDLFLATECADGVRAQQCESMGLTCGQNGQCLTIQQDSLPELDTNGNLLDGSFPDLTVADVPFVPDDAAADAGRDAAPDAVADARPDVPTDVPADVPTDVPADVLTCTGRQIVFMGACTTPPSGIRPLSGTRVGSNTPTFGIALPATFDSAQVQICRDRACSMVVQTLTVPTGMTTVAPPAGSPLPPGILFWRILASHGAVAAPASTPWWIDVPATAGVDSVYGSLPDFDGDGIAEVVIGAPYANSGQGAVFIYHGPLTASPAAADVTLTGPGAATAHFGTSVSSVGDLDGDGYVDLAVGAPNDLGGAGAVYIYRGGPTGIHAPAAATFSGTVIGATASAGSAVSAAGDITEDGLADLLVGAAGNVAVVPGSATATLGTALSPLVTGPASFGEVLSGAGDVNGDGNPDFFVGAQTAPPNGDAFLYETMGGPTLPTTPAFTASINVGSFGALGSSVFTQGDIDGDGRTDLVLGAPVDDPTGRVYYWLGSTGALLDPSGSLFDAAGMTFGTGVALVRGSGAIAGDTLVIGDGGAGAISFYELEPKSMRPGVQTRVMGPTAALEFGQVVAPAGDVNGDGIDDLLVGSPNTDGTGLAYVFFGHATSPAFATTPDLTFTNGGSLDGYGTTAQ